MPAVVYLSKCFLYRKYEALSDGSTTATLYTIEEIETNMRTNREQEHL